jgi:hypothetical protein
MHRHASVILLLSLTVTACSPSDGPASGAESILAPVVAHQSPGETGNFHAHASGAEEVPANDSPAQGQAIFRLSADGTGLHYRLIVANIENVTQAHIHLAPEGQNGPVTAWLYPSAPPPVPIPGPSQGPLNEGVITAADLRGPLAGGELSDLLDHLRAGNAYVNVHTAQFPGGEVRGQIR